MANKNDFTFFSNTGCKYFPCHNTKSPDDFNCLFCYCPLYFLEGDCGGNFSLTEKGVKDCSDCLIPHGRGSHEYICGRLGEYFENR